VLRWVERKDDPTSRWAAGLKARRHANVAAVALANKIARIAYTVLTTGQPYNPAKGAFVKVRLRPGTGVDHRATVHPLAALGLP